MLNLHPRIVAAKPGWIDGPADIGALPLPIADIIRHAAPSHIAAGARRRGEVLLTDVDGQPHVGGDTAAFGDEFRRARDRNPPEPVGRLSKDGFNVPRIEDVDEEHFAMISEGGQRPERAALVDVTIVQRAADILRAVARKIDRYLGAGRCQRLTGYDGIGS